MHTSAPNPPVAALMAATGSSLDEFTVWVAPKSVAQANLRSSTSTPTITDAPASRAPAIAASPTPPQPNTTTESPRPTLPVFMAAPNPAMTPHPSSPATDGLAAGFTLVACPAATNVLAANAPMPRAGDSTVPSSNVIFWLALCVAKQYQGLPLRHARHWPHTARQFKTT